MSERPLIDVQEIADTSGRMVQIAPKEAAKADKSDDYVLAEYKALRDEILKRLDIEHQIVAITLLATGTFIGVGLQAASGTSTLVLLAQPILVVCLATIWGVHRRRIVEIGLYIETCIERQHPALGWERRKRVAPRVAYARRVFLATEILVLGLALTRTTPTLAEASLLLVGLAVLIITWRIPKG